jgi:hypothetical protein
VSRLTQDGVNLSETHMATWNTGLEGLWGFYDYDFGCLGGDLWQVSITGRRPNSIVAIYVVAEWRRARFYVDRPQLVR